MPNDYFMEWIEWLEIIDNLPKADKLYLIELKRNWKKKNVSTYFILGSFDCGRCCFADWIIFIK